MARLSKILAASILAVSFAAPALASDHNYAPSLNNGNLYMFSGSKMIHMKADSATHAVIMKELKPMSDGTMIYVSGGKFYVAEDTKMVSGEMLSAELFGGHGSSRSHKAPLPSWRSTDRGVCLRVDSNSLNERVTSVART